MMNQKLSEFTNIDKETTQSENTCGYSDSDILHFLVQNSTISLEDVAQDMKKSKVQKVLARHTNTISQHKDGRWRTYVKQADGKRKLLVAPTEEKLHEILVEHYDRLDKRYQADHITIEQLYPAWVNLKRLHGASSTYLRRIDADWRNYYAGTKIVQTPLGKLNKLDMDIWVHELIVRVGGRKKQYYNISMIMRQILDYAIDADIIPQNPLQQVKINGRMVFTPEKKKPSETQVFTKQEVDALYQTAWRDFHEDNNTIHKLAPLAVMFQFQTGIRIGELCVVRYEDIADTDIYVQRMYRYEEKEVIDYVKGHHDGRYVTLTPFAMELIETAREYQKNNGLPSNGYIFSVNNDPLSYYAIRKLYYRYCENIGTCVKSSHKSRKTYISALIDAGVNINEIRELVGHADERTTYNSYCYDRKTKSERIEMITKALS